MDILIATKNQGKIREFQSLLSGEQFRLFGLDDFQKVAEVLESGSTFADNARLKAAGYATAMSLCTIADDSGLEIEALGGRPGVYSARYGGIGNSYGSKIEKLLSEVKAADDLDRSARFVSYIVIAKADGSILVEAEGICNGRIAEVPRGTNGFGYDPVFIPEGYDQTFGELPDVVKQKISHRAIATAKIIRFLRDFA